MREIPLTRGMVALVDDEDYEALAVFSWYARRKRSNTEGWYASRKSGGVVVMMHRQIMAAPSGVEVDHRDGNGLDNRRHNMRLCTHAMNMANSRRRPGVSGFRGVCAYYGRWRAAVGGGKSRQALGVFDSAEDAARAFDAAALARWGEFAVLNFPDERGGGPGSTLRSPESQGLGKCVSVVLLPHGQEATQGEAK